MITDVVNANMAAALRIVSVERGYDPREFALPLADIRRCLQRLNHH